MTDIAKDTNLARIRRYERRVSMAIWVAGGVAALVGFIAAGVLQDAPTLLKQLVFSIAILSGGAIAFARVGFEWEATLIKRDIEDGKIKEMDEIIDSRKKWPVGPERWWTLALWALALGWTIVFVGIWWSHITCFVRYITCN